MLPPRLFTPKVITGENLSPCSSLWVSLSQSEKGWSGYTRMYVFTSVCTTSGMLCVAPQTDKVSAPNALQPTLLLLCLPAGICYLSSLPSFSKLLEKLSEVFISQSNPYSRYPWQKDQRKGAWGGSMFGLGQPWVKLWTSWHSLPPTCSNPGYLGSQHTTS